MRSRVHLTPLPCPRCGQMPEIDRGLIGAPYPPGEELVVCPEQVSAMNGTGTRHCGSCAVCWQTDRPVVFVEH